MANVPVVVELPANPLLIPQDRLPPWRDLEREVLACTRCSLAKDRNKVVFGAGRPDADLMFIGEAPGRQEDLSGTPYAGAAGNLLDNLLSDAGLAREDCYLTTLVKCFPPARRAPREAEIEACRDHLVAQIAHVRPKVIVAFGETVTWMLLGRVIPLSEVIGFRFDAFGGVTVVPTHAPQDALRGSPAALADISRDLRTAKAVLDGRIPTGAEAMAELRARRASES